MTTSTEQRKRNASIRAWALENGWDLPSERGAIPAGVRAAYEAVHGEAEQPAPPDGPDWDAGAAALEGGSDPLDGLEDDLAAGEQAAAAAGPADAGAAPVTSLDEARDRVNAGGGRRPSWAKPAGGSKPKAGAAGKGKPAGPVKLTAQLRGDLEGKLAMILMVPATAWKAADPVCGGQFADDLDTITRKMVPIIAQSPAAVAFLTGATSWVLILELMIALQPTVGAAYRHHFSEEAQQRKAAERNPRAPQAPQQAAADPDLDMYSTDVVYGHVPAYRAG